MAGSKKKFYAVAVGRRPGVYTEWYGETGAEIQVRGYPGAVFKGFATRKAAEAFVASPPPSRPGAEKRDPAGAPATDGQPRAGDRQTANPPDHGRETDARSKAAPAHRGAGKRTTTTDTDGVRLYTDGSALNNPGPGGYGVVVINGDGRRELSAGFRRTTNNRMELLACIAGLSALKSPASVVLYSDSRYVVYGITKKWARNWQRRGWKKANGEPALNPDLWERLLALCDTHDVEFVWVKGHAGNPENERCDRLAVAAASGEALAVDENYERG